jgi:phosphate:Na+ symporter
MTDEVKVMLQNLWAAHTRHNVAQVKNIRAQDDAVDDMNQQLMLYLSQLGEMNNFDRKWQFTLLSYASELETIGDAIEKNLAGTVVKQLTDNFSLDPDDEAVLDSLYQKTRLQFDLAAGFITSREVVSSQKIINAKDEINAWCLEQKKTHYERLKPGGSGTLSKSLCFLDLLEGLRRINNHLSAAAYGFKSTSPRLRQTRMKLEPEPKGSAAKPVFGPVPPAPENPQLL